MLRKHLFVTTARPFNFALRSYSIHSVDASVLDFTKRNAIISKNLSHYYPSLSNVQDHANLVSLGEFLRNFRTISTDQPHLRTTVRGRIHSIRYLGKNMCFIDLTTTSASLQLILNYNLLKKHSSASTLSSEEFFQHIHGLKPGDHIQATGFPGLSQREKTLSLKCTSQTTVLSPAQLPLPPKLIDPIKRKQNRVVDYLVNGHTSLVQRHRIIRSLRQFLDSQEFTEVETPILSGKSNGAAAEPFVTRSKSLDTNLELRVAPELWLKRLCVGGIDRVYEIGKVFRNEGIDATHNQEFTTLEFYQSYTSMEELIQLSEQLLKHVISNIEPTPISLELSSKLEQNGWKFKRVEFLPTLSQETGIDFTALDIDNPSCLLAALGERGITVPSSLSSSPQQILNKLCAEFIENRHCNDLLPTVIYHHPTVMSPLAKGNPGDGMLTTKRFEIFIRGKEYINAYEEENCPQTQLDKFELQNLARQRYGDKESLPVDTAYVNAMKWGMPPIGGFGLGIDRLCMLLLGKQRIEEVLSFGCVDDVNRQ